MKGGLNVTCEKCRELMNDYLDHEISAQNKKDFEKHVAACPDCQEELNVYREMIQQFNEIEEQPLPEGFHDELMTAIRQVEVKKEPTVMDSVKGLLNKLFTYRVMVPTAALACMLCVVVISQYGGSTKGESDFVEMAEKESIAEDRMLSTKEAPKESANEAQKMEAKSAPEALVADVGTVEDASNITVTFSEERSINANGKYGADAIEGLESGVAQFAGAESADEIANWMADMFNEVEGKTLQVNFSSDFTQEQKQTIIDGIKMISNVREVSDLVDNPDFTLLFEYGDDNKMDILLSNNKGEVINKIEGLTFNELFAYQ